MQDMNNSDEEPDFTRADLTKLCNEPGTASDGIPRKYTLEDLASQETDPSCTEDWFLAGYWPVYVGNFKVEKWDESTWYEQISNYFAYNGLLTRMIYVHHRHDDKKFAAYQEQCMLIDMLVYFASKADANRAMATCHRDSYYGYKLHVLPGRDPVFFDKERSVRFIALGDTSEYTPLETFIGNALNYHGQVVFSGRYTDESVVIEFVSTEDMCAGVGSQYRWKPTSLHRKCMKQRFIEQNVKMNIERANEANPAAFMDMQPKPSVLIQLLEGIQPNVSTAWKGHESYVKSPTWVQHRMEQKQQQRFRSKCKKQKIPIPEELCHRNKTKRQIEQDNLKWINWFLQHNGAKPISRGTVEQKVHQPMRQKRAQGKKMRRQEKAKAAMQAF